MPPLLLKHLLVTRRHPPITLHAPNHPNPPCAAAANQRFGQEVEEGAERLARLSQDLSKSMDPVELSASSEEALAMADTLRASGAHCWLL